MIGIGREFVELVLRQPEVTHFPVENGGKIMGVVRREDAMRGMEDVDREKTLGEIATGHIVLRENSTFLRITEGMAEGGASAAIIVSSNRGGESGDIAGLITKERMTEVMPEALELF